MSGIVRWIRCVFEEPDSAEHLPARVTTAATDEDQQAKDLYHQSLLDTPVSLPYANARKNPSAQLRQTLRTNEVEALLHPRLHSLPNHEIRQLDFKQWKDHQKQAIKVYFEERHRKGPDSSEKLSPQQTSQESTQESSSSQEAFQESQEEDHYDRFESQAAPESQAPHHYPEASLSPSRRPKPTQLVPRVSEATHDVTAVSGVDLATRRLGLKLLRVKVVNPLRSTKRPILPVIVPAGQDRMAKADYRRDRRHPLHLTPISDVAMNDGPVTATHRRVLSMRVVFLEQPSQRDLRTLVNPNQTTLRTEMEIFFYDKWAENVSTALSASPREDGHDILLRLHDIPAKCVYPYEPSRIRSWMDRSLSDFCMCIGGQSRVKMAGGERLEHENDTMAVELLAYDRQEGRYVQTIWTRRSDFEPSDLEEAYESWKAAVGLPDNSGKESRRAATEKSSTTRAEKDAIPVATEIVSERQLQQAVAEALKPSSKLEGGMGVSSTNSSEDRHNRAATPTAVDAARKRRLEDDKAAKPSILDTAARPLKRLREGRVELTLGEAKALFESSGQGRKCQAISVSGVVIGFGCPSKTKRGQWKLSFSVFDDSMETPMTVVWFAYRREQLPVFEQAGDVVALRNVLINLWEGSLQLASRYSNGSAAVVVRKTNCDTWEYTSPPMSAAGDPCDPDRSKELWEWGQSRLASRSTILEDARFVIGDLVGRNSVADDSNEEKHLLENGDATLLVTGFFSIPKVTPEVNDGRPFGYLRVWDGTGPSQSDPLPLATPEANSVVVDGEPHPVTLTQLARLINAMNEDQGNGAQLMKIPERCCGKVTYVVVWEQAHWDTIRRCVRRGSFVRLRNVFESDVLVGGPGTNCLRCISVGIKSMITPVPPTTFEVKELLKGHNTRLNQRDVAFNQQSGLLSLTWRTDDDGDGTRRTSNSGRAIQVNRVHATEVLRGRAAAAALLVRAESTSSRQPRTVRDGAKRQAIEADSDDDGEQLVGSLLTAAVTDSFLLDCMEQAGLYAVRFQVTEVLRRDHQGQPNVLRSLVKETKRGRKFRFRARIRDAMGDELIVLVNDPAGEMMFGMSAEEAWDVSPRDARIGMDFALRANGWWRGQMCSHDLEGVWNVIITDAMISAGDL